MPWVCSTTTGSSKGCPRRRSTRACARRPPSAGAKRSRASRRSTSRRRPGRSCRTRGSSTRSRSSRGAGCIATRTCAAPSCATRSPSSHGVEPARLILGNGAAELLSSATRALIEPGPAAAHLVAVLSALPDHGAPRARPGGAASAAASMSCSRPRRSPTTRVIALASPNDPTGELISGRRARAAARRAARGRRRAARRVARRVRRRTARRRLAEAARGHPRLLVFRSFSKAWGLAGLRVGYAIGGPRSQELLAELEPDLGVSEVSQAGALEALRTCSELLAEHVETVREERPRLIAGAARARLRGHRQPGQLRLGRAPYARRRRARGAPRAGRRARRRRRCARRASPRAHRDRASAPRQRACSPRSTTSL